MASVQLKTREDAAKLIEALDGHSLEQLTSPQPQDSSCTCDVVVVVEAQLTCSLRAPCSQFKLMLAKRAHAWLATWRY